MWRNIRILHILDDFNREALGAEVDYSLPTGRTIMALEQVIQWRGKPQMIRSDNGPEFISKEFTDWAQRLGITLLKTQPGNPQQNAYVERFNRTARQELYSQHLWNDLAQVQDYATAWLYKYYHDRPHKGLNGITPKQRLAKFEQAQRAA